MELTREDIEQLDRDDIEDARRLSVKQKLEAGGDLFDSACEMVLSGIRFQHPGISTEDALEMLRQRLALARTLETRL